MIRWKPFAPWLTVAIAILAGSYYSYRSDQNLAFARATTAAAVAVMDRALDFADSAEAAADLANARADSLQKVRITAAPRRAAIVALAPDTCAPAIAALEGERDEAVAEAGALRVAYISQLAATAELRAAGVPLADAATDLVTASRPSFWSKVAPKVGVGGTLGIDPLKPHEGIKKVVGVTLVWTL